MHIFWKIVIGVLIIINGVVGQESEAKKACDIEISKKRPDRKIVKRECLITAKEYEIRKKYGNASWYYLLGGDIDYNVQNIESKIKENFSNIAHSYVLRNDMMKARGNYKKFLRDYEVPAADKAMQDDYALLFKLYPEQRKRLMDGLGLWNELYGPLHKINILYPRYKKAKKEGRYKRAIKYLKQIIDIQKRSDLQSKNKIFRNILELASLYGNLAEVYYRKKDYTSAIKNMKKSVDLAESVLGKGHKDTASAYSNLGLFYEMQHNYTEAIASYKTSLSIKKSSIDNDKKSLLPLYLQIGIDYKKTEKCKSAIEYLSNALYLAENFLGETHKITGIIYSDIGECYNNIHDYKKSLQYFKKRLNVDKNNLGKLHRVTATSYSNLAILYENMNDCSNAIAFYKKSIAIKEILLNDTQSLVENYESMAICYRETGNYKKALEYAKKSLDLAENTLETLHPSMSTIYNLVGLLYQKLGKYKQALIYLKHAAEIHKKTNDKYIEISYNNIGNIYQDMGDYPKALSYLLRSLKNSQNSDKDPIGHINIGSLYEKIGNYQLAFRHYHKALKIIKETGKTHSRSAATLYNNMGWLYQILGDYKKALDYQQKSINIDKKLLGKEMPGMAINYLNMGFLHENLGNFSQAMADFKKSLNINKKYFGDSHSQTAKSYSAIGALYRLMKKYDQSLVYLKKSYKINEQMLGLEHKETANNLALLSLTYWGLGNYTEAIKYSLKALKINKNILGKEHFDTGANYETLGELYLISGNYSKAYNYAKQNYNSFIKNRDRIFSILTNSEKEKLLQKYKTQIPLLFLTACRYIEHNTTIKSKISQDTLSDWLRYKGSIFDSENAIATLYANTRDKALKEKIEHLIANKRALAKLYQTLPKPKGRAMWRKRITQTEEQITALTQEIASKAEKFKEQQGLKNISYTDIAKYLKGDELYIDYARGDMYYYIFTLDSSENITFTQIDANKTKKIDNLVKAFRADTDTILNDTHLTDEKLKELTQTSKKKLSTLYTLLTQPIRKELQTTKSLIISPDGALKLLPFETLYDAVTGKYFIEEKDIRYIPSGKELARLYKYGRAKDTDNRQAVIFDDPDFDAKGAVKKAKEKDEELSLIPGTGRAGIVKSLFKMRFNPLPGTKAEAQSIKRILKDKAIIKEYKNDQATETNLLKVKRPNILHIATHGFFINDNTIPNPMLKSGIALSGANTSAIHGRSDGIVTALKLSGLELKGTDLVVLSACQTGVVDINSTDSVSGLSKAFIQAGAKDIVMSLWSVNDQATKKLMESFYKQMQTQANYATALKQAKLEMIRQDMHPFYWGGFILNGI